MEENWKLMKDKRYWANTAVQLKKCTSGYLHLTLKNPQTLYLGTNNDKKQNNFSAPHSHLAHCRRHKMYRLFSAKIQFSSELFQIVRSSDGDEWWVLFVKLFLSNYFHLKKTNLKKSCEFLPRYKSASGSHLVVKTKLHKIRLLNVTQQTNKFEKQESEE